MQSAVLRSHDVRPSVRLSVCPSGTLVDQDHIGWMREMEIVYVSIKK